jgi:DNA gyrase subunit A
VDSDELMIITKQGQMIRMPVKGISVIGRNTQGVRLVNLAASPEESGQLLPDTVGGVTRVVSEDDEGGANGDLAGAEGVAEEAGESPEN